MKKSNLLHFFLFATFIDAAAGESRSEVVQMMCDPAVYKNSTIAVRNFFTTMNNISGQMQSSGFGISTTGSGLDSSYGLAQCYGDLSPIDCVMCYAKARTSIPVCFPSTSGRLYLDGCFMRHEAYRFFDEYKGSRDRVLCGNTTRKSFAFQESARQAVNNAVSQNSGYARADVPVKSIVNESAYVMADCWKTLNSSSCEACLANASASILTCFPWSEGRVVNTGCFMRYSDTNFLNSPQGNGSLRGTMVIIVVAVLSSLVVLVIGGAIGVHIWKRRKIQKKRKGYNDSERLVNKLIKSALHFKYSVLEKATGNFDEANKLGQGGFGTVYKGVLADGREIAVKRLFFNHKHRAADFYNEVNIISSTDHKNLVRLLGCSCSGPESLLACEFLPNKSLDQFIFDPNRGIILNWMKRYNIILETAEGLVYLHENAGTKIIHRDIKASNILLDSRFHAKIADFGLARSFEDKSHISTAIAGTLGYLAPEYLVHGRLTEKVDVYCFGVLVLEIVTGRRNNLPEASSFSDSLVMTVWERFQERDVDNLIDPNILSRGYEDENIRDDVLRVLHVGLLCTQESPSMRPTMLNLLEMLKRRNGELPDPTEPPFRHDPTMELNITFSDSFYTFSSDARISNVTNTQ